MHIVDKKMKKVEKLCGVYAILNIKNWNLYVGSSQNIYERYWRHLSDLKRNKHVNKRLQLAFNKYGEDAFKLGILELPGKAFVKEREQHYINSYPWDRLYNLAKDTSGGGGELTANPLILLDLEGNIVKEFRSGLALAEWLGRKQINYGVINKDKKIKNKYWAVTPAFYQTNQYEIYKRVRDIKHKKWQKTYLEQNRAFRIDNRLKKREQKKILYNKNLKYTIQDAFKEDIIASCISNGDLRKLLCVKRPKVILINTQIAIHGTAIVKTKARWYYITLSKC